MSPAEQLQFLEYGICKVCGKDTIFEYLGLLGEEIGTPITLYNCLKCKGTYCLDKLERRTVERKKVGLEKKCT